MNRSIVVGIAVLLSTSVLLSRGPQERVFPDVNGWVLTSDETVYTPDNLWDVIDGAADLFLEYDFVDLHIGRYKNASGLEIKVELYRHGSSADAFGMYSQERYPDYHFIDLGVQGYEEKGVLNFLAGHFYVKISTIQSGPEAQGAMHLIAGIVEKHLRQPKTWPIALALLPTEGRVNNSEQYIAKNFLGYSFFNSAFVANYGNEASLKAFVMRLDSEEDSKAMIEAYLKSLPKEAISTRSSEEFRIRDPHSGTIYLGLKGRTVFGVTGDGQEQIAEGLLDRVRINLVTKK